MILLFENFVKSTRASVIIVEYNNEILLLKRNSKMFYNQWGLPGGKIDPGEEKIEAAVRELYEETGIIAKDSDLIYVGEKKSMTGFTVYIYWLKLKEKQHVILSGEHNAFMWVRNFKDVDLAGNTENFINLKDEVFSA